MTEFKQLTTSVEELIKVLDDMPKTLAAAKSTMELYHSVEPKMTRFKTRAAETDPDKKIYGPGMVAKINELHAKFVDKVAGRIEAVMQLQASLLAGEERVKQEAAAKAQKEQEELRLAEERRRQELAAAAEAARKQQEEAERRQKEENAKALAQLERLKEQKKAAKEAEKAAKLEAEKRIKEENEKKAAAAREAEAEKLRAEAKARVEAMKAAAAAKAAPAAPPASVPAVAATPAARAVPAPTPAAPSKGNGAASSSAGSGGAAPFSFGVVTEICSIPTFEAALTAADDAMVVVDFFAQWCGPCRRIAPEIAALAATPAMSGTVFLKVDSDAAPDLSASKGIRALPTFHIYWRGKLQEQFSGADMGRLTSAMQRVSATIDEILTAEAVAASLEEEGGAGAGSSSSSSSSSAAPAKTPAPAAGAAAAAAAEDDDEAALAAAMQLSMDQSGGASSTTGAGAATSAAAGDGVDEEMDPELAEALRLSMADAEKDKK